MAMHQFGRAMILFVMFLSMTIGATSQSTETFNYIRLEDPSSIGSFITLQPPSGISPYSLTWPASMSAGTWGLKINGSTGTMTWGPYFNLAGSDKQLAFFRGTDSVKGSSSLTWDDTQTLLTITNSAAITASDTIFKLQNTATSSTASIGKVAMYIASTGTLSGASTTNTALSVDASGAASNYAALFVNGRVGVGTSSPNTMLDVTEDVAYRELNYTTVLSGTSNDVSFNTGNKAAFVRLGGASTAAFTVTGFASGVNGKILTLFNNTGQSMIIKHDNTGSTAANRVWTSSLDNLVVGHRGSITFKYSSTESRWIAVSAIGTIGQTDRQTTKTVTATDKNLPSADNNYIRVTNNSGTITPTFDDGSFIGQILVIQNDGPNTLSILNQTNLACDGGSVSLGSKDLVIFVWDGTKWYQIAQKAAN